MIVVMVRESSTTSTGVEMSMIASPSRRNAPALRVLSYERLLICKDRIAPRFVPRRSAGGLGAIITNNNDKLQTTTMQPGRRTLIRQFWLSTLKLGAGARF